MKTYEERTNAVLGKIEAQKQIQKNKRTLIALVLVLGLSMAVMMPVLFIPYDAAPPDVSAYSGSPYYSLIEKINEATYTPPEFKNNFDKWTSKLLSIGAIFKDAPSDMEGGVAINGSLAGAVQDGVMPTPDYSGTGKQDTYVETTDNQVQGVIEADLIKRSDKYIYYLRRDGIVIYSIEKEESEQVGQFSIPFPEDSTYWLNDWEMYLSEDCTRITLMLSGGGDVVQRGTKDSFLCIISLDVSDPANVQEVNRQYITGSYLSSRKVFGDTFLVMSLYQIRESNCDFDQPETFLPQVGSGEGEMECVDAEDIVSPETLSSTRYTVVTMLSEDGLQVLDTAAFLSYSQETYVSADNIYATRSYSDITEKLGNTEESVAMTEISCIAYSPEGLEVKGSAAIEGSVRNQYSMDEYEGHLRVVTSTTRRVYHTYYEEDYSWQSTQSTERNVNLYCISLADWSIAAEVEAFAPDGETAESVRFDGDSAYVCTAEVIQLTDPVYFFDLSDLKNITWKDTGTIEGYSSSLVNFGEGYLLGIGYSDTRGLKIEIYEETETGVASVCSYELDASFAEDYKSYFIDRENNLVGLGIFGWYDKYDGEKYILLGFDGYKLTEIVNADLAGRNEYKRGVLADGWLYLLSEYDFKVEKVW